MTPTTGPAAEAPSRADPFARDAAALFGLPFDLLELEGAASRVAEAVRRRERLFLSTVNLDWLVTARRDAGFRASALASDLVTMDGVPVVALARLAGAGGAVKVAGSDLFERLRREELSVFFFGGREGAGAAASRVLAGRGEAMQPAGHLDPGWGDVVSMSAPATIEEVNASGADLLVASLGAAKGQAWLMANEARLSAPVIAHLGAVVDFTAGTVARAPAALQQSGLEWAWRIGQDRALWSRYAGDALALPALVREAREVGALTRRLARGAPSPALRRAPGRITIEGAPDPAGLGDALREAHGRGEDVEVRLDGAALTPRLLGRLLIARSAFARAGLGYALCTGRPETARLLSLALGPEPAGTRAGS
jgi:N-acetylglucosaminyldiphosphoundecaprenol N-acetyl-beta-D-mannosaminyltransferase